MELMTLGNVHTPLLEMKRFMQPCPGRNLSSTFRMYHRMMGQHLHFKLYFCIVCVEECVRVHPCFFVVSFCMCVVVCVCVWVCCVCVYACQLLSGRWTILL